MTPAQRRSEPPATGTVLVARLDSLGDVLLCGPAVRAVAAHAERVVLLAGPRGTEAAKLLPGADRVITWCAPWIDSDPPPVTTEQVERLRADVAAEAPEAALILTSFHQSPLPLALILRLAGVPWIAATSEDYPGSLLDLRHRRPGGLPESERMLDLAAAAGYTPVPDDRGALELRRPPREAENPAGADGYVVVHPGASAPSRAIPPRLAADTVRRLAEAGHRVILTGAPGDRAETGPAAAAVSGVTDLTGRTGLAELAAVLRRAKVAVCGNTGPAHLAAAVGTPVVSLFAPVVPASAWAPHGVPTRVLGDQQAPCRGSRARVCPVPGHPCLNSVHGGDVAAAVAELIEEAP